jgi:hypothetical protein
VICRSSCSWPERAASSPSTAVESGDASAGASSAAASATIGRWPGTSRAAVHTRPSPKPPSSASGSTPARHKDDLPTPESPATTTSGAARRRSTTAPISAARPQNTARCSASKRCRPRYGLPTIGPAVPWIASSAAISSSAEAGRAAGARARQRSTTAANRGSTPGATVASGGASEVAITVGSSIAATPAWGGWPVVSS